MNLAIETKGLVRRFGEFAAVDGIDLKVERGTLFGFLGPNGAGKSTTIKMLTGLMGATSGKAYVLGRDIAKDPVEVKRRIGVVPEELALFDRLTGPEYLEFCGRMYGLSTDQIPKRTDELLGLMGLQEDREKLILDYSHGMQKKLAISAALLHGPDLVFLDEPFEGVDAISSRLIKDLLHSLLEKGVTVFLTSHILEIVEGLCTDLAIIHKGRLVAEGSLDELRAGIEFKGGNGDGGKMTLEQVFLSLVGGTPTERATLSWLE